MLKVLKELKIKMPDFKIALCGKGIKEKLHKVSEQYNILDNIEFKGDLGEKELSDVYSSSSCFLSTSKVEGLPQAAIEALSFGIPCVVTDVGEYGWLIRDGVDGAVIKHGDTAGMVDAIFAVLSNSAKFAKMRENSENRFKELEDLFSIKSIAENWKRLIQ